MSGYTIRTPVTILTTLIQDAQAAGSINPQDIRDLFASVLSVEPNTQTGSYTLTLNDIWEGLVMNSASAVNVTVPPNSSVAFQVGATIPWYGQGAGLITFVQGAGVTIERRAGATLVSAAQGASGGLWQRAANTWVLSGDIT